MELTWKDWPAQRQRGRAVMAAVVIGATSISVAIIDPLIAAVSTVALLAAVSEVLLPTTYTLGEEGVLIDNVLRKRRHPWRHFRGWRAAPGLIALRGAGPAKILRRRRSVVLRCPDNAPAVRACVSAWLSEGEE